MVEKLRTEKRNEIKKHDYCIEELDSNEHNQEMKTRDKDDLTAAIEELKLTTENRAKENKAFEDTVADQRATAKLLTAALGILKGFYGKAALVQTVQYTVRTSHDQA